MIGPKVLLIDSEAEFLESTSLVFKEAGMQVITARDGMEGISKVFIHQPHLIILDAMISGRNGVQVYQKIRQYTDTPVIMLSALGQEHDIPQSFKVGSDDFLSKPIHPEILLVRARAMMHLREQDEGYHATFHYDDGHLRIDVERHRVQVKDKRVKLTPREFRLLVYLASNSDKVLSFDQILVDVWEGERRGNKSYVHVYISHLRSKIEENVKSPRYIRSVRGVGYIFENYDKRSPIEKAFESHAPD